MAGFEVTPEGWIPKPAVSAHSLRNSTSSLLQRSRELTRGCSPKVTHQSGAGVVGVDTLRGHWTTARQDLARAKQFEKTSLNVASYFSAPRRALHASCVDDARPKPARLRRGRYFAGSCPRHIVFSVGHFKRAQVDHFWLAPKNNCLTYTYASATLRSCRKNLGFGRTPPTAAGKP